jgi:hypothetical protein
VPELSKKSSRRQWKECCGRGCSKWIIAGTYLGAYGPKKSLGELNEDRAMTQAQKRKGRVGKPLSQAAKGRLVTSTRLRSAAGAGSRPAITGECPPVWAASSAKPRATALQTEGGGTPCA